MKRNILVNLKNTILIILLALIITSCGNSGKVKIGFLMPADVGSRWVIDQKYVEEVAKKNGCEILTRSAKNDENLQMKQAEELLDLGVDVLIVVAHNANTAAAIVRSAHDKGVPVIGYDRLIKNSDLDYLVTFEGAKIGSLMLDYALARKPQGNYVMLWGDAGDVNAIFIKDAQEKILKPYIDNNKINIVYKALVDDWSEGNANYITKKILSLSGKRVDAIITSYDGLAIGAIKAMDELEYGGDVIVTGQDAEIAAIKAVVAGKMSLTIYKSIRKIAEASVELAIKLARGERVKNVSSTINNGRKDVPTLFLDPVAVTKDNIRQTVIADGFFTEQEIYGNN